MFFFYRGFHHSFHPEVRKSSSPQIRKSAKKEGGEIGNRTFFIRVFGFRFGILSWGGGFFDEVDFFFWWLG